MLIDPLPFGLPAHSWHRGLLRGVPELCRRFSPVVYFTQRITEDPQCIFSYFFITALLLVILWP